MLLTIRMKRKRILLVDDDPVFVKATSMRLATEKFEVVTAEDGADTLKALRKGKPDLVLLDILFPPDVPHGGVVSWDGFDIISWLRRMGGLGNTPVILVTASDPFEHRERARKMGADAIFQKGVDMGELMSLIHQFIDPVDARQASVATNDNSAQAEM